jgi:hypothetical protein
VDNSCPNCGFTYAWDGKTCGHCRKPRSEDVVRGSDDRRSAASSTSSGGEGSVAGVLAGLVVLALLWFGLVNFPLWTLGTLVVIGFVLYLAVCWAAYHVSPLGGVGPWEVEMVRKASKDAKQRDDVK